MNWILDIYIDVMPIIAPNAPKKFKKLIPKRLAKRLGEFDPERWTSVLSKHRIDLIINECESTIPVVAEYNEDRDYILLQITDTTDENLVFHVIQTIMHEYIHVDQSHRDHDDYDVQIDTGSNDYNTYLSLKGELEAYAHCLFLEFMNGTDYEDCFTFKMYNGTSPKVQNVLIKNFKKWIKKYKVIVHCKPSV